MDKPQKTRVLPVFEDERGQIIELTNEPVHHVGIVTFTKGAIRGKHYHKESDQWNYVLEGKIELTVKDIDNENSSPETTILVKGDSIMVGANWYHKFKGLEDSSMLFSETGPRKTREQYEKDTHRMEI